MWDVGGARKSRWPSAFLNAVPEVGDMMEAETEALTL